MSDRIMVVDDEAEVLGFCAEALRRLGYDVTPVGLGEEALDLLRREHFDLLITDIMMPGMSGIDLIAQAKESLPNLAAIVMTGYSTIELAIKALRSGAVDFIPKPFSLLDLREGVEHALTRARIMADSARARVLMPLFELSKHSLNQLDADALCAAMVDMVVSQIGADGGAVILIDAGDERGVRRAAQGVLPDPSLDARWIEMMREASEGVILSTDAAPSPDVETALVRAGVHALLCAPLRAPSGPMGLLLLARGTGQSAFGQGDAELAFIVSSQVATLLENSRLVNDLRAWNRDLEARVKARTRDLIEAHSRLLRTERLATVGKLGAGVAHELRNPLGVINNSVYYLKTRLGDADSKVEKHLNIIEREVESANRIITDLMNFVRVTDLRLEPADLNALVMCSLERTSLPEGIRVHCRLDKDLPLVPVDGDKIQQVLLNLINNAIQAMPSGGALYLSTALQNGHVVLHVRDSGIGISADCQERIFEPLFTTRAKGIGLGLSLVKLLVEAHRGKVAVSSREGEGACFIVRLPYSAESSRAE